MDEIKIVTAQESNLNEIYYLLRQLWPEKGINLENLKNTFLKGLLAADQYYFIARTNNDIFGFASLTIKNNLWQEGLIAHIDELVVDKNYRRKGIGSSLIEKLCEIAEQKGCKKIELDSAFHRKEAHEFYEKHNFNNRAYLFSKDLFIK